MRRDKKSDMKSKTEIFITIYGSIFYFQVIFFTADQKKISLFPEPQGPASTCIGLKLEFSLGFEKN